MNEFFIKMGTAHGVWRSQKKSHSTLQAKRAKFWVDKSWLKMPKMVNFGEFLKTSATRQGNSKGQKLTENAKIQKLKCDILDDFQTLWCCVMLLRKSFTMSPTGIVKLRWVHWYMYWVYSSTFGTIWNITKAFYAINILSELRRCWCIIWCTF